MLQTAEALESLLSCLVNCFSTYRAIPAKHHLGFSYLVTGQGTVIASWGTSKCFLNKQQHSIMIFTGNWLPQGKWWSEPSIRGKAAHGLLFFYARVHVFLACTVTVGR